MTPEPKTVAVSLFREVREIEMTVYGTRAWSTGLVVVGRFPTGTKTHASTLTLWSRDQGTGRPLPGPTAAVIDGKEWIADTTLRTHNSNQGRIFAWNDDLADSTWKGH